MYSVDILVINVLLIYAYRNLMIVALLQYFFSTSVASPGNPRKIHELDDKVVVAIVLGPNADYPNAYMHISGEFVVMIPIFYI